MIFLTPRPPFPVAVFLMCVGEGGMMMTTTPSASRTPLVRREGDFAVCFMMKLRIFVIAAYIVRQINVYKFYRPYSCLRRNDKKVRCLITKLSPRRRPGSIVFLLTLKLGGMQWIPAVYHPQKFLIFAGPDWASDVFFGKKIPRLGDF